MTANITGAEQGCECCQSIIGREFRAASYRWIGPHGNLTLLCESCCAIWRLNARDDPSLEPQRITPIERHGSYARMLVRLPSDDGRRP